MLPPLRTKLCCLATDPARARGVDLHADAGWRVFSFLKIETDAGVVGWSEYNESYGSKGLTGVILKLAETLIGQDPRPVERITANLYAKTRQAPSDRRRPRSAASIFVGSKSTVRSWGRS